MIKIVCMVPEEALSRQDILRVESVLVKTYREMFETSERVIVFWYRLPEEQRFVAGEKGENCYLSLVEVKAGLAEEKREEFSLKYTRALADCLNVSFETPVVTFADSSVVKEVLSANSSRLRWRSRAWFMLNTLIYALRSKKRDGFASMRINL